MVHDMQIFEFTNVTQAHEFHASKKAEGYRVTWGGQVVGWYPTTWRVGIEWTNRVSMLTAKKED